MNRIFVENFVNETNNQILRAPDMRTACFGAFAFKIIKARALRIYYFKGGAAGRVFRLFAENIKPNR